MSFGKYLVFVCFILNGHLFSQNWEWAKHAGGTRSDKGTAIVTDANGFSYITGYFNGTADFDTFNMSLIGEDSHEVFIAKLDPFGNYVWVKRGSNLKDDRGLGICLDPSGNIYVTGACWGGITFGSLSEYNSTQDTDQIFVLKLDTDGNFIWLKNVGNNAGDDHGYDIISDSDGNIYVTGFITDYCFGYNGPSVAQFGTETLPLAYSDSLGFVAKISNDGVWQWLRSFEGVDGERTRIGIDQGNNIYISGGFRGVKDFGTSSVTSAGGTDIFVAKYNSNGVFQFVKNTGGMFDDRANDITVDVNNDVYITGEFSDQLAFGTDTLNNYGGQGKSDIFVAKMDTDGNWKWATKAGSGFGEERGCGINSNSKSNLFVSGQYSGNADFGSDITLTSVADSIQIFVAAIDTLGKWHWAVKTGGQSDDKRANAVSCDTSCNVYVTGFYKKNSSFGNSQLTNFGGRDIFISKINNACFEYITDTLITVNPDPQTPQPFLETMVYIPNAFSPDGNELNQVFKPSISSSITPKNYSLKIFNQWGQILFESMDYNVGWDGTIGSFMSKSGLYTWKLEFDIAEKHYNKIGHVVLLQ